MELALGAITLVAATVNGAIGYGFSSITVPLALLFVTSRALNPALILIEVPVNLYVLAMNRASVPIVLRGTSILIIGLVPGIAVGSLFLASAQPDLLKLVTYVVLIPLILIQAGGLRRPFRSLRAIGLPFGAGVGLLYSATTISGPPLALLLNNQGYAKRDFRGSLALVRAAESSLTALSYGLLGLYTPATLALMTPIVPAVLVGIPLGAALIRRVDAETFRRVCMSFDAWIVGFGLSRLLDQLAVVTGPPAYVVLLAVASIDVVLLYRFFLRRRSGDRPEPSGAAAA